MKQIGHLFDPSVVEAAFREIDIERKPTKKFEFIAALVMHRLYEHQWNEPTMIGFYLSQKGADTLQSPADPDPSRLVQVLCDGIAEDNEVDFMIVARSERCMQTFQLKRFGFEDNDTAEALVVYLNAMAHKYARSEAACLVYLRNFANLAPDLSNVANGLDKAAFPFSELLLIGEANGKSAVAGLLPKEGFSAYDLSDGRLIEPNVAGECHKSVT